MSDTMNDRTTLAFPAVLTVASPPAVSAATTADVPISDVDARCWSPV
jgi:hypothetical protein